MQAVLRSSSGGWAQRGHRPEDLSWERKEAEDATWEPAGPREAFSLESQNDWVGLCRGRQVGAKPTEDYTVATEAWGSEFHFMDISSSAVI